MAEKDPSIIGARIAERRHQLDMTQNDLAAALGVSPSTVANWERGTSYPKRKMGKVKQLLGSDIDSDGVSVPSSSTEQALDRAQHELELLRQLLRESKGNDNGEKNGGHGTSRAV